MIIQQPIGPEEKYYKKQENISVMEYSTNQLIAFLESFLKSYKDTIEKYFSSYKILIPLYKDLSKRFIIFKVNKGNIEVGIDKNSNYCIDIIELSKREDLITYLTKGNIWIFTSIINSSNESIEKYSDFGIKYAIYDAFTIFWNYLSEKTLYELSKEILEAEGIHVKKVIDERFNYFGIFIVGEPGGFKRTELWAIECHHYQKNILNAEYLRNIANSEYRKGIDIICIITSDDMILGKEKYIDDETNIRIWDRNVLSSLLFKHNKILEKYSKSINVAFVNTNAKQNNRYREQFGNRLKNISAGIEKYNEYENLGTEMFNYIFKNELGNGKVQKTTIDKTQRRDVLFKNMNISYFFQRIKSKFGSEFVIVDFKNYKNIVSQKTINEVSKYANSAIGRFIIVVSRKGSNVNTLKTQIRILRDHDIAIIVINDIELIEMVERKDIGLKPESILDDKLDELLICF
jgi:hypothetical protein